MLLAGGSAFENSAAVQRGLGNLTAALCSGFRGFRALAAHLWFCLRSTQGLYHQAEFSFGQATTIPNDMVYVRIAGK